MTALVVLALALFVDGFFTVGVYEQISKHSLWGLLSLLFWWFIASRLILIAASISRGDS